MFLEAIDIIPHAVRSWHQHCVADPRDRGIVGHDPADRGELRPEIERGQFIHQVGAGEAGNRRKLRAKFVGLDQLSFAVVAPIPVMTIALS